MSQPRFVPQEALSTPRFVSPPQRYRSWQANRPGDVFVDGQPHGAMFGSQGPDQGFALRLARNFEADVHLQPGEHLADVQAGCVAVALKRASGFGRAPSVHDLRCAYELFGFFDPSPEAGFVAKRAALFEEVSHPHHHTELRAIADLVPGELLHQPHDQVIAQAQGWRSGLDDVGSA